MLFNDVIVTSSTIEYQLVYNYVDRGRISIPTKLQTNTPNNKEVAAGGRGGDSALPANVAPKIARPGWGYIKQ